MSLVASPMDQEDARQLVLHDTASHLRVVCIRGETERAQRIARPRALVYAGAGRAIARVLM